MRIPNLRRGLFLCLMLVAAVVFCGQAWERLQGQLYYLRLEQLKAQWQAGSHVPHDRELNEGFTLGYTASEHQRDDSDYRYLLASLHAWRERGLRLWPQQAAAENKKVEENLKAALVRRPSWFEAWILLALVKFQANEVDHEMNVALEKSIETGQFETTVHHGLSYVGLRVWDRLGPRLQKSIVETLDIALDNRDVRKFVVEQIVVTGRVELFRDKLESDEELAKLTNRFLEKRNKSL
ncbi:MAG: hypothetical protein WAL83_11985 [Arenicellales bacterium]